MKCGSQPHRKQERSKSPAIRPAEMRNPSLESHSLRNTWLLQWECVSLRREAGWHQMCLDDFMEVEEVMQTKTNMRAYRLQLKCEDDFKNALA